MAQPRREVGGSMSVSQLELFRGVRVWGGGGVGGGGLAREAPKKDVIQTFEAGVTLAHAPNRDEK